MVNFVSELYKLEAVLLCTPKPGRRSTSLLLSYGGRKKPEGSRQFIVHFYNPVNPLIMQIMVQTRYKLEGMTTSCEPGGIPAAKRPRREKRRSGKVEKRVSREYQATAKSR